MLCLVSISQSGQVEAAFAQADRMYPRKTGRDASEDERLWLDDPYGYPLALLSAPSTAALRRDPRFVSLAERVGLLKYWRSNGLPDFCRPPAEPVCARLRHAGSIASRTEPIAKPT